MAFKYEKKLSSYGLTAEEVGSGLKDKIKKFLKIVKEQEDLKAKLSADISEQKKQAIQDELDDIDIDAADDRLVNAVETWFKNKDTYADNVKKMAAARAAKARERGEEPKAPVQKPAPQPQKPAPVPPPVPPASVEQNPEPVPPVLPAPVPPAPPVQANVDKKETEAKNELQPEDQTTATAEPEKKDNKFGFGALIVAGIVLALTGIALRNRS